MHLSFSNLVYCTSSSSCHHPLFVPFPPLTSLYFILVVFFLFVYLPHFTYWPLPHNQWLLWSVLAITIPCIFYLVFRLKCGSCGCFAIFCGVFLSAALDGFLLDNVCRRNFLRIGGRMVFSTIFILVSRLSLCPFRRIINAKLSEDHISGQI